MKLFSKDPKEVFYRLKDQPTLYISYDSSLTGKLIKSCGPEKHYAIAILNQRVNTIRIWLTMGEKQQSLLTMLENAFCCKTAGI